MRPRDVQHLYGHSTTKRDHVSGWLIWPILVCVDRGLFFSVRPVWMVHHHPRCAELDQEKA